MAQVSLKNLGKRYGKAEIIHSIDLEVIDNEFLVLVGPRGVENRPFYGWWPDWKISLTVRSGLVTV